MNSRSIGSAREESRQNVFLKIDDLVRRGQGHTACATLRELVRKGPTRDERLLIANLARRCGDPMLSIMVMRPIVRPASGLVSDATPQEKICYAASLIAIGASAEAFELLRDLDVGKHPEILFHTALSKISEWRYEEVIPILTQYVQSELISEYQRLVGNLNLSGAYIFVHRYDEAEVLLRTVLQEIEHNHPQALLIKGVALEYLAQIKIALKQFSEANHLLSSSADVHSGAEHVHRLTLEKWLVVSALESVREADPQNQREACSIEVQNTLGDRLRMIRKNSIALRSWETARECDFLLAKFFFDWNAYMSVRFGSPLDAYQKRLDGIFGPINENSSASYDWSPGEVGFADQNFSTKIDLSSGMISFDTGKEFLASDLRSGLLPLRLLNLLCEDFYRPIRIGQVFKHLYPSEHFNPFSSPKRIAQIVLRLNQLFESQGIDVRVSQKNIGFSLSAGGGVAFTKSWLSHPASHRYEASLSSAKTRFQNVKFSISDFKSVVGMSSRSAERVLRWGVEQNLLRQKLAGRSTYYSFVA